MDISIIIPAFNEEKFLESTLDCVTRFVPQEYQYEIIIIDNNSTDRTVEIAKRNNAIVLEKQNGTIGTLRNIGVKHSKGKILLFLDADVLLTEQWKINFPQTFDALIENPHLVTGSTYGISQQDNIIEKYWFKPLLDRPSSGYINSGHLIVTRSLFDAVKGFDETLVTGEDYDFSQRCKANGAIIVNNKLLYVQHEGYPKTIKAFFNRESWHGMGDFQTIKHFTSSYVAMFSIIIFIASLFFIFNIFAFHSLSAGIFTLLLILFICLSVTIRKYKTSSPGIIFVNSGLYYIYFIARAYSLIKVIFSKSNKRIRLT